MAIIYDKKFDGTGVLLDQMLILEPREALIYPFDFGDDWTEIRLGAIMSIVDATGDNEYIAVSGSLYVENLEPGNPSNTYYFGFIGWTGDIHQFYGLPAANGSYNGTVFVGATTNPYLGPDHQVRANTINGFEAEAGHGGRNDKTIGFLSSSGLFTGMYEGSTPQGGGPTLHGYAPVQVPLSNNNFFPFNNFNYGAYNSIVMRHVKSTNKLAFAASIVPEAQSYPYINTSNMSILNTRRCMAGDLSPTNWLSRTCYFTHNGYEDGIPEPVRPSAILIYSPFYRCKLRIHSLVVERFM